MIAKACLSGLLFFNFLLIIITKLIDISITDAIINRQNRQVAFYFITAAYLSI